VGTNWDPLLPASPATLNRDYVIQVSLDSGVTWYTIKTTTDDTHIELEEAFGETTVAGGGYISRYLLLGNKKISLVHWVGATANHKLTIRDANYNIKIDMTAVTADDSFMPSSDFWMHGFAVSAIGSGVAYVYLA